MIEKVEMTLGGRNLYIETGRVAKQADGAVIVGYGDTVILATAVASKEEELEKDFFPLQVEYREKKYSTGMIPGNIGRREARPLDHEILSARQIDHQIRPLFPGEFKCETQIIVMVLSFDKENEADVLGMIGASAALCISGIPFMGPSGAVRVGRVDGQLIINPTLSQLDDSDIDLVVGGKKDTIMSVEGSALEISDKDMLEALKFGHEAIKEIIELQERLIAAVPNVPKREIRPKDEIPGLKDAVEELAAIRIKEANRGVDKEDRSAALGQLETDVMEKLSGRFPEKEKEIAEVLEEIERADMRQMVITDGKRIDGRTSDEIRPITCEVGVLPRVHGSALFTRGQTQSLAVTTLGTKMDERMVDDLEGKSFKRYMLDYNFPPFCTGEVKRILGPSRRDIGHGALAEKSIEPMIPPQEDFIYTIRVVSEILESNSSSSMATVCAGSLSLMDAGVPVRGAVAGVGIGSIKEGDRACILSDIMGAEDHWGDMDLKVAGTRDGITAIQMDIKIEGISFDIVQEALERAGQDLHKVLDIMDASLSQARPDLSPYAPLISTVDIKPSQIGIIIGPKGSTIREMEEVTGAKITVEDDGRVVIASVDKAMGEKAVQMVEKLVEEAEVGKIYDGKVKRIMDFGAFVEIIPGKDGLVHISELEHHRVDKVEDVLNLGDNVTVKVIGIDGQGKIKLSRKATMDRKDTGSGDGRSDKPRWYQGRQPTKPSN